MPTATNKEQTLIKACEKWLTPCHLCVYRKQCIGSFNSAGIWYLINNVIDEEWSSGEPQSSTVMRLMNEITEIKSQSTVKKTHTKTLFAWYHFSLLFSSSGATTSSVFHVNFGHFMAFKMLSQGIFNAVCRTSFLFFCFFPQTLLSN